jgi:tetratricopeptide (TPR) repeat protein
MPCGTACAHAQASRFADAQACWEQVLSIEPNHERTVNPAGLAAEQVAGQSDRPIDWFASATKQIPKEKSLSDLGTALLLQGRHR